MISRVFGKYIAAHNLDAAERILEEIYETIRVLVLFPHHGQGRSDLTARPLRFHSAMNFLIVMRRTRNRSSRLRYSTATVAPRYRGHTARMRVITGARVKSHLASIRSTRPSGIRFRRRLVLLKAQNLIKFIVPRKKSFRVSCMLNKFPGEI